MTTSQSKSNNGRLIAIIAMFFLFAMISFVTNLAAPIGTIWGFKFSGNGVLGMMGNMMNFLAYLFMGIPAGNLLAKIGYKKTALWAMAVGVAGLFIQYLCTIGLGDDTTNYCIYLLGAFVCGFCVCMLNTVVNPMLNLLGGGGNKGNQLLQMGGTLNSTAATLTPLFVGMLIGQLSTATQLSQVAPLLWMAMGVFVLAFLVVYFVAIPEPQNTASGKAPVYTHSPLSFRHTLLGVIGIFIYVGIEVGIPGTLLFYLSDSQASGVTGNASAIAGAVAALYWLLMLVGRLLGSFISGAVSSRAQLIAVSSIGAALVIGAICIPSTVTLPVPAFIAAEGSSVPVSAYLLVLCGLCTSVMWGGIFNLAVEGLGKYTAKASGIFMTMVVGGGVIPLVQQWIAGFTGYMASYWLIVLCLVYLLYYGLVGSKNVNTDIPVDDEVQNAL